MANGVCCWRGKSERGIFVRLDRGNFGMEGPAGGVEREGRRLGLHKLHTFHKLILVDTTATKYSTVKLHRDYIEIIDSTQHITFFVIFFFYDFVFSF
jgi:hypothetical protein